MILMFLERAHGCLGAWKGGPEVPGPLPWAPRARPRGAPRGGVSAVSSKAVGGYAPLGFASFFMFVFCSISPTAGLDLGLIFGTPGGAAELGKSALVHPVCRRDSLFFACSFSKMSRCMFSTFMFVFIALPDGRARFGAHLGKPRGGPRQSWDRLGSDPFSPCGSGSLFAPSWAPLAVVLGPFWPHFGPSWGLLGPFWVVLGSPGVVFGHSGWHFGFL